MKAILRSPGGYNIYKIPPDYKGLQIKYLHSWKEFIGICKSNKGYKTLIFVSNIKSGEKINEAIEKEGLKGFLLTSETKETEEGKKVVRALAENSQFNFDVLICTKVLDVGVSIKDPKVTQIIIRAYESHELIQMLGRLRVDKDIGYEGITLYLNDINIQDVKRRLRKLEPVISLLDNYQKRPPENNYAFKTQQNPQNIELPFLYQADPKEDLKFSPLAACRLRKLYVHYSEMLEGLKTDPSFYLRKQLEWLGFEDSYCIENYATEEALREVKAEILQELENLYQKFKESRWHKDSKEKKEFLGEAKKLLRRIDSDNVRSNPPLSWKRFNKLCKLNEFPYEIKNHQGRKVQYEIIRTNCQTAD